MSELRLALYVAVITTAANYCVSLMSGEHQQRKDIMRKLDSISNALKDNEQMRYDINNHELRINHIEAEWRSSEAQTPGEDDE